MYNLPHYLDAGKSAMTERLQFSNHDNTIAIQRLTALWALNECGLGGILHAFNSPFTGLLVGSLAMVCITFICAFAKNKWRTVMTSLIIVLIIKALVSPQSPPTAYIAVAFQGVAGALIFRLISNVLVGSLLLFTLGLLESAFQRILTMTIIYGNPLWEAINIWGKKIAESWGVMIPVSSSQLLITIYVSIYFVVGLLMGWTTWRAVKAVKQRWGDAAYQLQLQQQDRIEFMGRNKKSGKRNWMRYALLAVVVLMIPLAYSQIMSAESSLEKGLMTLLRVTIILILWFVVVAPFFIKIIQSLLRKKHKQLADEVSHTMDMFPQLLWIINKAWKETNELRWLKRWKTFIVLTMAYILQYRTVDDKNTYGADPQL
jgi:hypothetical protein